MRDDARVWNSLTAARHWFEERGGGGAAYVVGAPALKAAHAFKKHSDYISALSGGGSFDGGEHTLLATSGDGTLSGCDMRKAKRDGK